jgi:hypothetical protein
MGLLLSTSRNFSIRNPKLVLKFTTIDGAKYEISGGDFAGDIVSIRTSKRIREVAGTWTIEMVARDDLRLLFKSLTRVPTSQGKLTFFNTFKLSGMVDISIQGEQKMIGIIDSVRKKTTVSADGKPSRRIIITGRDLGALLVDHKIWYDKNPETSKERGNNSIVAGAIIFNEILEDQAHKIMQKIYQVWFEDVLGVSANLPSGEKIIPFSWADGESIPQKLTCEYAAGMGLTNNSYTDFYNVAFKSWNQEGSIFDLMKQFSGAPFNELFVDTGGTTVSIDKDRPSVELYRDQVHTIYRPSPFTDDTVIQTDIENKLDINDLPYHEITDADIVDKDLGIGKNEMYSIYMVYPMANLVDTSSGAYFSPPEIDSVALNRYGHRPLTIPLGGWDDSQDGGNFTEQSRKLQRLARSWYQNNDKYLTGTIKIKGREMMRVGHRLDYVSNGGRMIDPEDEGYYYINGLDDIWKYGQNYESTAYVARGTSKILRKDFNTDLINTQSNKKKVTSL